MTAEQAGTIGAAVVSLLTSAPIAYIFGALFTGGYERAARRVSNAVAVREALEKSLTRAAALSGQDGLSVKAREQLLRAEQGVVLEALAFDDAVFDYWAPREGRAWRLIVGGVIVVVAVAAITGIWLTDVDTVWIWTIVAVYLFGCVVAGAGLVDYMLNERRTAKRDRLVELGLYNPVKDSHLPAAEPDQPGLIQRLITFIMSK